MKKVNIIKTCLVDGVAVEPTKKPIEVSEKTYGMLMASGKATAVKVAKKEAKKTAK